MLYVGLFYFTGTPCEIKMLREDKQLCVHNESKEERG